MKSKTWIGRLTCPLILSFTLYSQIQPAAAQSVATLGGHTPPQLRDGTARLTGHYNSTQALRLVLALQPPHMAEEEQFLKDLHTKGSPEFHHFLTADEWNARFAPSAQDEQGVVDWAQSQGLTVTHRFPNRLLVDVEAPAATIEKALNVTINRYQLGAASYFSNDRDPAIPATWAGIVHSVQGLNNIQHMHPTLKGAKEPLSPEYAPGPAVAAGANARGNADRSKLPRAATGQHANSSNITNGLYDPTDIYSSEAYDYSALYNQGHCCNPFGNPGSSPPESSIAIATFGGQNLSDIAGFQSQYPYLAYNIQLFNIDGTPPSGDEEGTMDAEWSTAMANSFGSSADTAKIWVYQGANFNNSTFTDLYNFMLTDGNARVFSTSWSCTEFYGCDSGTMDSRHNIFNQMVGQGWTLVAASGDRGSADDCNFNNPAHESVAYPASDPDVVGAGGTILTLFSDSTYDNEVAWYGGQFTGACSGNDGGSGGGISAKYSVPGYQTGLPGSPSMRQVPDLSLNAAAGQNIYFGGSLAFGGGTSIVAPELAGFFAQENAYLLYVNSIVGNTCGNSSCAPMGNPNWYIYYEALNAPYAAHYPFYDITLGCNSNDATIADSLGYYCAGSGYDNVTGWGTGNMLQLAWAINTYLAGDFSAPAVTFSGPATGFWYNTDHTVSWTVTDTTGNDRPPNGVAGFSQAWDFDPSDVYSESTPGHGNSFYSGPEFPNATSGSLNLAGAGSQGCHSVNVRTWDNAGSTSDQVYGPLCYDTVAPSTSASVTPSANGAGWHKSAVVVTLHASDPAPGSGIFRTYYSVDNAACSSSNLGACLVYGSAFNVTTQAKHAVYFFSEDNAGNFEARHALAVNIDETAPHTSATLSGTKSGTVYVTPVKVTLVATDNLSGIANTVYQIDGGSVHTYTAPFTESSPGSHKVTFHSTDKAGNVESTESVTFAIKAPAKTSLTSSLNPSTKGKAVTFTATVTPTFGSGLTGSVTFKNGTAVLGTVTLNTTTHKAALSTSTLTVGTHAITAVYGGSTNFEPSTSAVLNQVVK